MSTNHTRRNHDAGAVRRDIPRNFLLILGAQFFTKLGDALSNPKIVLSWLFSDLGVPVFFTGLLVPLRESGSLLPQLFIGSVVRRYALRKWFFVAGCLLQALAVAGMAMVALFFRGSSAGWSILGLLVLFSLARGVCSIASKDVVGKTIPKSRRGRLGGYSASAAGLITIGVGLVLIFDWRGSTDRFSVLLMLASCCWLLAALNYALVREGSGASSGGDNALRDAIVNLSLLKHDQSFRRFVLVRSLMMSSGLSAPYFILLARDNSTSDSMLGLGVFIALGGFAGLISGPVWGRLADRSSRKVMLLTAGGTAMCCALASVLAFWGGRWVPGLAFGLFFLLTLTHQGVRLGRKTYLIDIAEGNRRTDYVSVSNTVIGALLLVAGLGGALVAQYSVAAVLALLSLASALALSIARRLPEA